MNPDPNIHDEMTASGYVRCGGCGGYLPAGAICGYCLQQQQAKAQPIAMAPARPRKTRPFRAIATLTACALVVCGIGAAAVFAARSVSKATASMGAQNGALVPGMAANGADGSEVLASSGDQDVMNALASGDTQQALSALGATGEPTHPTLPATAPAAETPIMQQPAPSSTPTMQVEQRGMPDDVRRWLEHLQKIEQARVNLAATQLQGAVKTLATLQSGDMSWAMGDGDEDNSQEAVKRKQTERAQKVGGNMQSMQTAWRTLSNAFNSMPPPAECAGIKANYDQVIGQTGSMIMEIVGQLQAASSDPQAAVAALTAMQGQSKSKIDVPARAADQGVAGVCRKYDTVKWFDIQNDVGAGTMSQLGF